MVKGVAVLRQNAPGSASGAKRDETGLGTRRGARQSMAANWRILSANLGLRTPVSRREPEQLLSSAAASSPGTLVGHSRGREASTKRGYNFSLAISGRMADSAQQRFSSTAAVVVRLFAASPAVFPYTSPRCLELRPKLGAIPCFSSIEGNSRHGNRYC